MSTVVVGYDASPSARAAVELAAGRLAPDQKLVIVHAYHVPSEYLGTSYYQDLVDRALDKASAVMDGIEIACPALRGVDWEPDVIEGGPAEVLCRVASHRRAAEIVLGTRGVGRVRGLLGSVAHDVIHLAHCPVLVVPERAVAAHVSSTGSAATTA
jgi:nucleotide-binding universal stress UspA family protein